MTPSDPQPALVGVNFRVDAGETVAIVGESGSGKTVSALATIGLLPAAARVTGGRIGFAGRTLMDGSIADFAAVRGREIAMIFQEPMTSLNPALTVAEQIGEVLVRHRRLSWRAAKREAVRLLDRVGIPDAARRAGQYVHQLSGGMRQRVMIAGAISCAPKLLIADEPTTALDVTVQAEILDLLRELRDETGMGVLFITHDLGVVAEIADRTSVMYAGRIVEEGSTAEVLRQPLMPYTKGLLESLPREDALIRLRPIPGGLPDLKTPPPGCIFADRCAHRQPICDVAEPPLEKAAPGRTTRCVRWRVFRQDADVRPVPSSPEGEAGPNRDVLVEVAGLVKHFPLSASMFAGGGGRVRAVEDVSFSVRRGEILSLVGESGSGKTTVGRCILRLTEPTRGTIRYDGCDLQSLNARAMAAMRRRMQVVFQDPFASLNPALSIGAAIAEPIRVHGLLQGRALDQRVEELLTMVGLDPRHARRRPASFSGGQRQRIAIARALALGPQFLVADEAVSALDISIRAQVTNLLQDLQRQLSLTLLFIAHDLALVRQISDRVVILYLGRVMEEGPVEAVFNTPGHPYTKALLSAVPIPDPDRRRDRIVLRGQTPSAVSPPSGCVFRTRCPSATRDCARGVPPPVRVGREHTAACLYAG